MPAVMLINKKRGGRRRKLSAKQIAAGFGGKRRKGGRRKGTSVVVVNKKRKARKRGTVVIVARNKKRRSRRGGITIIRRNPANPVSNPVGFVSGSLIPAAVGAAGAIAIDAAWGMLPLPAALQSGTFAPVARIGAAVLLGIAAGAVAGKRVGAEVAAGGILVQIYNIGATYIQNALPNLQLAQGGYSGGMNGLGWYNPGRIVGRLGRVGRVGRYTGPLNGIPRMPMNATPAGVMSMGAARMPRRGMRGFGRYAGKP